MKNWMYLTVALALIAGMSGCGGPEQATNDTVVKLEPAKAPESGRKPAEAAAGSAQEKVTPTVEKMTLKPKDTPVQAPSAEEAAGASTGPQPKITSPEPVFDFGEMDNTLKVEHDFILRNAGNATLKIDRVKTSCGCTVAKLAEKDRELEPGEETKISTVFVLRGRRGQQRKTITVSCNDPVNKQFKLELKGKAVAAIMMEPQFISFGKIQEDSPRSVPMKIYTQKKDLSFKIASVDSQALEGFQTELKVIQEGKSYELAITAPPDLAPGNHTGTIKLTTDNSQNPTLNVRVTAQVVGDFDISPSQINIRFVEEPERRTSQYIRVSAGRVKAFELTQAIAPIDSMEVEIQPRRANDYLIKLSNMPQNDELEGKELLLRTNLPDKPEIRVPFQVIKPRFRGPLPKPPQRLINRAIKRGAAQ